jgi:hypothetical protein
MAKPSPAINHLQFSKYGSTEEALLTAVTYRNKILQEH